MWVCQSCLDTNYVGYTPQDDFATERKICPTCPYPADGRPKREAPCFNTKSLVPKNGLEEDDSDLTEAEREVGRVTAGPSGLTPKTPVDEDAGDKALIRPVPSPQPVPRTDEELQEEFNSWDEYDNSIELMTSTEEHAAWTTPRATFAPAPTSYLYFETFRPQRIYQYSAPPSPGDLYRIQRGKLRVFHVEAGAFQEIDESGKPFSVNKFQCPPKATSNDPPTTK